MYALLAALVVVTACVPADSETVTLDQLPIGRIILVVGTDHTFYANLESSDAFDTCPVLGSGVTATLAGEPMALEPGAFLERMDGYAECRAPKVSLDHIPAVAPAALEVLDRTRTITCDLDVALIPRTATPDGGGPWLLAAGQRTTVTWSSPEELASDAMFVTFDGTQPAGNITASGDRLTFDVPALAPGTHVLHIKRGSFTSKVKTCSSFLLDNISPSSERTS